MVWMRRIGLGLVGVVVVALLVVYAGSELVIRRARAGSLPPVAVPSDAASIAEGARLARVTGCRDCHGVNG